MVQSLDRSQGRSGAAAAEPPPAPATFTGNRALMIEEPLIFEMGQPGRCGVDLPEPPKVKDRLNGLKRAGEIGLPGLCEPQVVRHYTRLSQKNYAIDMGVYPLGSCTMKHNPRLNEKVARLPGFGDLHPLQPVSTVQGALALIDSLAHWLKTLTGMPAVAMSPAAGAHGEMCGMMAIAAALEARGERAGRRTVLAPESAHGTNPATAAALGFTVKPIPANERGRVDLAALKAALGPDVAAIMLTNPNTCGLFEHEIVEIARAVHAAGAYFYCDGANFNAIVGRVRPGDLGVDCMHINLHKTFSTPHGGGGPGAGPVVLSAALAPYAPYPWIVRDGETWRVAEDGAAVDGQPLGRLKAFHGQMGMFTRALAYMMSHGADGLKQASEDAVLTANYVMASLRDVMTPAFDGPVHARGPVRRRVPQGHRGEHARLRQGDDRRGLSPDDHVLPAGGARRDADRADREPGQGRARPVHRRPARAGRAGEERHGGRRVQGRSALRAAPAPRRDAGGAQAGAALAADEPSAGRRSDEAGGRLGAGLADAYVHRDGLREAVVFLLVDDERRVLLECRPDGQGGFTDVFFPSGSIETRDMRDDGSDYRENALRREVFEEFRDGVAVQRLRLLGEVAVPEIGLLFFVYWVVSWTGDAGRHSYEEGEPFGELRWLPADDVHRIFPWESGKRMAAMLTAALGPPDEA